MGRDGGVVVAVKWVIGVGWVWGAENGKCMVLMPWELKGACFF